MLLRRLGYRSPGQGLGGREYCCEPRQQQCVKQSEGLLDPQALLVCHDRGWTREGHTAGKVKLKSHAAGKVEPDRRA